MHKEILVAANGRVGGRRPQFMPLKGMINIGQPLFSTVKCELKYGLPTMHEVQKNLI